MRPLQRYHFPELPSTNDKAKELSTHYAVNEFLVVTADVQTSGRGRNGKTWLGEYGDNVYCSFATRHSGMSEKSTAELAAYQVRGALSVIGAVRSFMPPMLRGNVLLKYPNDVLMLDVTTERKKISGVLVEHEFIGSRCVGTVIGIGINVRQQVFPPDLASKASSLLLCGVNTTVEEIVNALMEEWKQVLEIPLSEIFDRWWEELNLKGASVAISGSSEEWTALRLNADGTLLVENQNGEKRAVTNGDSLRRLDWR